MIVYFKRLKLFPANVRSSSYCPQDAASHSSQFGDAVSSPVNTETYGSGGQVVLIPDNDERVVDLSVLAAESTSTMDHGDTSAAETTESTSITESASTTEETPVE